MDEFIPHFKFEKLQIWQKAMDFGDAVFELSKSFPKDELYNLISQSRRAADSIALNIAEGSISQSNPEFTRFLNYAIRSLAEVVTCLHKAKRREYISQDDFTVLYKESFHIMNMLQSFKSKLN
ncbi:four helix bundle protein [Algoriphagus ornithinivorans]|uniref:Four helix bundle protein n=1 Tax=Algoriphagus ornithinivorans TaxID=226506 RepID=A0A1I5JRQ2_9BACT|nr:four helix bundle protein [Algoriphagus ornithinivorans]SFO75435.1 four helix bundle protein [Algoriphagus ornithinivorans]